MESGRIKELKKIILRASAVSQEGHVPSAFSILDILWVLYHGVMRIDPHNPQDDRRDRLILSKGHAALGLYAVLAEKGYFPMNELEKFGRFDSMLGGHPDRNKVPGVEASTGSLGHGFPIGLGIALGLKIKNNLHSKVYLIIGDGECNEGTNWESALLAAHHGLNNLCCIVDFNHSTDRALPMGDLVAKFKSFGWDSFSVDGHNHNQLSNAFTQMKDKPLAIVAETIKGRGCPVMENNPAWHHKSPSLDELDNLLSQIV